MPVYEYICKNCTHEFTDVLPIAQRKKHCEQPCPKCATNKVEQKVSAITFVYNRSGALKTNDSFNDRMKEIKKNVPTQAAKDNVSKIIR